MYLVTKKLIRHILRDIQYQIQFFAALLYRNAVNQIIQEGTDIINSLRQLHLLRFQLGKVQNITDQRKQNIARLPDIPGILLNRLLLTLPQDQLIQPKNRIDRRSKLMGHICQKNIPGKLRFLHRALGRLQLYGFLLQCLLGLRKLHPLICHYYLFLLPHTVYPSSLSAPAASSSCSSTSVPLSKSTLFFHILQSSKADRNKSAPHSPP